MSINHLCRRVWHCIVARKQIYFCRCARKIIWKREWNSLITNSTLVIPSTKAFLLDFQQATNDKMRSKSCKSCHSSYLYSQHNYESFPGFLSNKWIFRSCLFPNAHKPGKAKQRSRAFYIAFISRLELKTFDIKWY